MSFYTFETLSYVIDVYRRITPPARSILDYAIFITFFPRLVSGPIMRGQQFLSQLEHGLMLTADNFTWGARIFMRGLFKKMVSITEFWQRWHISLSTWLRDYLYMPLGGKRKGSTRTHINLLLTVLLGGLSHGASWNFVL